jgi:hypothetical protein
MRVILKFGGERLGGICNEAARVLLDFLGRHPDRFSVEANSTKRSLPVARRTIVPERARSNPAEHRSSFPKGCQRRFSGEQGRQFRDQIIPCKEPRTAICT